MERYFKREVNTIEIIENKCETNKAINTSLTDNGYGLFPYKTECTECDSIVSVDEDDLHIGWLGEQHFTCPCCGEESMVDELEGIRLTIDNLKFPEHFLRTNINMRNVMEINNEDVIRNIKECVRYLRANKDEYRFSVGCGDLMVFVSKLLEYDEYDVVVSKDFYETRIPFERRDY